MRLTRRTNSDKVPKKSGASGFLAKYRARKSRDSKDLSDSTLPPGVPPPVTNGYAANGVNEQGEQMVYLTPEGVQQLIADSMAPFLEDTSQIKVFPSSPILKPSMGPRQKYMRVRRLPSALYAFAKTKAHICVLLC